MIAIAEKSPAVRNRPTCRREQFILVKTNAFDRLFATRYSLFASCKAAYDAANEQVTFNSLPATFDANGNQTTSTDASGTTTYTWDARNRMVAQAGPSVSASFVYDALGRRVSKTVNGVTTSYLYDGNDIVQEIGGSAVGASYVRSLNIDEAFVRQGASNEFYHADALGSSLVLSNAAGATAVSYGYEAFGKTTINGTSSNPFQYTGRENDGGGIYFYRARYYSPIAQRFVSEDSLACQRKRGRNLYAYVDNNPINFIDPLGLEKQPPCPPGGCAGQAFKCYTGVARSQAGRLSLGCIPVAAQLCLAGLSLPVIGQLPPAGPAVCTALATACAGALLIDFVPCYLEERECESRCGP